MKAAQIVDLFLISQYQKFGGRVPGLVNLVMKV